MCTWHFSGFRSARVAIGNDIRHRARKIGWCDMDINDLAPICDICTLSSRDSSGCAHSEILAEMTRAVTKGSSGRWRQKPHNHISFPLELAKWSVWMCRVKHARFDLYFQQFPVAVLSFRIETSFDQLRRFLFSLNNCWLMSKRFANVNDQQLITIAIYIAFNKSCIRFTSAKRDVSASFVWRNLSRDEPTVTETASDGDLHTTRLLTIIHIPAFSRYFSFKLCSLFDLQNTSMNINLNKI